MLFSNVRGQPRRGAFKILYSVAAIKALPARYSWINDQNCFCSQWGFNNKILQWEIRLSELHTYPKRCQLFKPFVPAKLSFTFILLQPDWRTGAIWKEESDLLEASFLEIGTFLADMHVLTWYHLKIQYLTFYVLTGPDIIEKKDKVDGFYIYIYIGFFKCFMAFWIQSLSGAVCSS